MNKNHMVINVINNVLSNLSFTKENLQNRLDAVPFDSNNLDDDIALLLHNLVTVLTHWTYTKMPKSMNHNDLVKAERENISNLIQELRNKAGFKPRKIYFPIGK